MSNDAPGLTIVELPTFMQQADNVWKTDELEDFKDFIVTNPLAGDLISGAGGVRKVRWTSRLQGKGKRGGSRVIYYYFDPEAPLYLFDLYLKGEKIDIDTKTKAILKNMAAELKKEHKRKTDHAQETPAGKSHGRSA